MPGTTKHCEKQIEKAAKEWLLERGITIDQIVPLVMFLQKDHYPNLTPDKCYYNIEKVLTKREVHNAVLTGIQLDVLAEQGLLREPLQNMLQTDEGLYGIDEILALSILNIYGSIGFTNYGYIDRVKPGILADLNNKDSGKVHTFLDDIVGAIAAAAASRLAHTRKHEIDSTNGNDNCDESTID